LIGIHTVWHREEVEMQQARVSYWSAPAVGAEVMSACSRHSYPRHWHDTYGIGRIDAGGQSWWSGRGQVRAGPGTVITQNPGEVHDGSPVGSNPRSWRMLYVDPARVATIVCDLLEGRDAEFEFASPALSDARLAAAFDHAFQLLKTPCAVMRAETALTRLFSIATRHASGPAPRRAAAPAIDRAREMIDCSPAAPLSLSDLAQACSLSRYQLIRGFDRRFGLTPHAYIVQRRLELSRRLLREGRALSETALLAGFYDQAHFTRHFSRQFGISPGAYRRCGAGSRLHFSTR
jgi:AraC-like DNA-binding protein